MVTQFDIERFTSEELENQLGEYWIRIPEQIRLLNRLIYLEWASARTIAGWVPAAEEFEWKCALVRIIWHNMTIADRLLERKQELSSNRTITIPSETLHTFVQNSAAADGFFPFVAGWFLELTRAQIAVYEQFMEALDPIFDAPTLEILQEVLPKKRQQVTFATTLIHDAVKETAVLEAVTRWRAYIKQYLQAIGGLTETEERLRAIPSSPVVQAYGPAPRQVSHPRWLKKGDLLNPPEEFANNLRTFMWHYATEIQVVDPMCYIFYGVDDMPFEFYVDLSRHIWDESRHHLMGVRRLRQLGYDLKDVPLPFQEEALQQLESYYSTLTMIGESCSFNRKRDSLKAYYERGDIISGMTAEIDITDERSHVRFGKKWIPQLYRQRFGDSSSLTEIVDRLMQGLLEERELNQPAELTESEKDRLSHAAFCGKIEFKYLNFERP